MGPAAPAVSARRSRASALAWVVSIALFASGAALIGLRLRESPVDAAASPAEDPPLPEWLARTIPRDQFVAKLTPLDAKSTLLALAVVAALKARDPADPQERKITLDMQRVLRLGEVYDSQLSIFARREGSDGLDLTVRVARPGHEPFEYSARIERGALVSAAIANRPLTSSGNFQDLPVAFGDVSLRDVLGLASQLRLGACSALGVVAEGMKCLVFDVHMTNAKQEHGGSTALIYVSLDDLRLRAIRVFDEQDRLVRVYDDFQYDAEQRVAVPTSFRATSIECESHSVIRLQSSSSAAD